MPSVRQIRRRIRSVENTAKITKAMSMIAASKMRRAQESALSGRPYSDRIQSLLSHLAAQPQDDEERMPALLRRREVNKVQVVVITPDRGLTGGLNSNINRAAAQFIVGQSAKVSVICVGRKGRDFMVRSGQDVRAVFTDMPDRPQLTDVTPITRLVIDAYAREETDAVYLAYADFVNTTLQRPVVQSLLPVEPADLRPQEAVGYIYEPFDLTVTCGSTLTCAAPAAELACNQLVAGATPLFGQGQAPCGQPGRVAETGRRGAGLETQPPGEIGCHVDEPCGQADGGPAQPIGRLSPGDRSFARRVVHPGDPVQDAVRHQLCKVVLVQELHRGVGAPDPYEKRPGEGARHVVVGGWTQHRTCPQHHGGRRPSPLRKLLDHRLGRGLVLAILEALHGSERRALRQERGVVGMGPVHGRAAEVQEMPDAGPGAALEHVSSALDVRAAYRSPVAAGFEYEGQVAHRVDGVLREEAVYAVRCLPQHEDCLWSEGTCGRPDVDGEYLLDGVFPLEAPDQPGAYVTRGAGDSGAARLSPRPSPLGHFQGGAGSTAALRPQPLRGRASNPPVVAAQSRLPVIAKLQKFRSTSRPPSR